MKNNLNLSGRYQYILDMFFDRKYLESLPIYYTQNFTGKTIIHKLWNIIARPLKFIKQFITYETNFREGFNKDTLERKTWLFITSKNNRDSLKFLLEELDDAVIVGDGFQIDKRDKVHLPVHKAFLYFYKFPVIWWSFYKKYNQAAVHYIDFIFETIGLYEVMLNCLKKYPPSKIVLANDHSRKHRALLLAAKNLNIPVVYIQHASISRFMPALDFDLSLLEGQDALDKYKSKGEIRGKVKLIGMPKFDDYINYRNFSTSTQRIGICINLLDKATYVTKFIEALQQAIPSVQLCLRPHPADKRIFDVSSSVEISTREEGVFSFLKRQDLIIAGNSSVHLEAILLNVTSIYFEISPMEESLKDGYGYAKNGLIPKVDTIESLVTLIQKEITYREPVFEKARYYNALVGTTKEGKSSSLAGMYIRELSI